MEFLDKNQTLTPPAGYAFYNAESDGAYLRLTYRQGIVKTGTLTPIGENRVTIYLNDMGREVGRTLGRISLPEPAPAPPAPTGRKFRFKNGFLIILTGIQEMAKSWRGC